MALTHILASSYGQQTAKGVVGAFERHSFQMTVVKIKSIVATFSPPEFCFRISRGGGGEGSNPMRTFIFDILPDFFMSEFGVSL